jgi:hypothetical protein
MKTLGLQNAVDIALIAKMIYRNLVKTAKINL